MSNAIPDGPAIVRVSENVTVVEKIEVALSAPPPPPPWWTQLDLGRWLRVAEWLYETTLTTLFRPITERLR